MTRELEDILVVVVDIVFGDCVLVDCVGFLVSTSASVASFASFSCSCRSFSCNWALLNSSGFVTCPGFELNWSESIGAFALGFELCWFVLAWPAVCQTAPEGSLRSADAFASPFKSCEP